MTTEDKVREALSATKMGPLIVESGQRLLLRPDLKEQLSKSNGQRRKMINELLTQGQMGAATRCTCGAWIVALWDNAAPFNAMWDRRLGGYVKKHLAKCKDSDTEELHEEQASHPRVL